jgi:predicted hydrocarbon binding protein
VQASGHFLPNRIARYFFLATEEVMGQGGLNTLLTQARLDSYVNNLPPDDLRKAFTFAQFATLNVALEDTYGTRGGRGMALRIGRASFSMGMKNFGALAGMGDPAFRARPRDERCLIGLKALALVYNRFSDQQCAVEDLHDRFQFVVQSSPAAWGRQSDKPVCHAQAGIIQECMRWAANGYEYYVYESACKACGDPQCVFVINKTPMG